MPDRWVDRPRVYPHKCAISGKGDIESGPYYEFAVEYYQYPADDATPARLYISEKYLRAPFGREDAPLRLVSETEHEQLELERQELITERDELAGEVAELERQLDVERDTFAKARTKRTLPRRAPKVKDED